jgi:hypothetical protein
MQLGVARRRGRSGSIRVRGGGFQTSAWRNGNPLRNRSAAHERSGRRHADRHQRQRCMCSRSKPYFLRGKPARRNRRNPAEYCASAASCLLSREPDRINRRQGVRHVGPAVALVLAHHSPPVVDPKERRSPVALSGRLGSSSAPVSSVSGCRR